MEIIKDLNSGTLDSDDTEDLETELDKITERVSLVDRAVTALRKMGIGPATRSATSRPRSSMPRRPRPGPSSSCLNRRRR